MIAAALVLALMLLAVIFAMGYVAGIGHHERVAMHRARKRLLARWR